MYHLSNPIIPLSIFNLIDRGVRSKLEECLTNNYIFTTYMIDLNALKQQIHSSPKPPEPEISREEKIEQLKNKIKELEKKLAEEKRNPPVYDDPEDAPSSGTESIHEIRLAVVRGELEKLKNPEADHSDPILDALRLKIVNENAETDLSDRFDIKQ